MILVASCAGVQGYQKFIREVHSQDCLQPIIILETEAGNADEFNYLQNGADFYLKSWRNEPVLFEQAVMAGIERVKAFQGIHDSEKRMRGIFLWSSIGIVLLDLTGLIVQNNPAFAETVGFSDDELCEMGLNETLIHPHDQELVSSTFERVKEKKLPVARLQSRMHTKAGSYIWAELTFSLFSETGMPAQFCVCLVEDITDQKNMESELRKSEFQLKQLTAHLLDIIDQERRRIAQELHDSIGSYLGAIKLALGQLPGAITAGEEHMQERIDHIAHMLTESMDELQRITSSLYPPILDDLGIVAALKWHADRMNSSLQTSPIIVDADINESRIKPGLPIVIYRVSQEAIHNALKHSRSASIVLCLTEEDNSVVLRISDQGMGFPEVQADCEEPPCGMGIRNMMKRVEFSGGVLTIRSTKGKGTTVSACWPVATPSE